MLVDNVSVVARVPRIRNRLTAAATAKQKLSTRFQPQRKQQHRFVQQSSSVKRAKTFSLGGAQTGAVQTNYKTLPKQASSRSLGSTSTDSSHCSQAEISQAALEEIAAFEKFISEYFDNSDNNNT